jgi:hypothetical protein
VSFCSAVVHEKLMQMVLKTRTRLCKLCSRATAESDPQKLAVLLTEIDNILSEALDEIAEMLKEVEQVLKKRERESRVHLT